MDHQEVYDKYAVNYEVLISREDYQDNLLPAIESIYSLRNSDVVELGAGTGRLTCMLAPSVKSILAFDQSPHMLSIAEQKIEKKKWKNVQFAIADNESIPALENSADLALSGWSIAYCAQGEGWQNRIEKIIRDLKKIVRESGCIILIETMGTGYTTPTIPESLKEYYQLLEEMGFQNKTIRTDYQFESLQEAEESVRFFFGNELANKVIKNEWEILPECTGIWWLYT